MPGILPISFFDRPVLEVARGLIGASLVRRFPDGKTGFSSMLTEVEAYDGPLDLASHASKGRTPRTEVMYGPAGVFYVYLIYGIHWMLNVVTGETGYPAAVLIRGTANISGPGRITARLQIDESLNGKPAKKSSGLWFEDRSIVIPDERIETTPRIGVEYSGDWSRAPYRFILRD
jgi:DNA-3-methyladenine glycosylase